jgi:hypothetical protein
MVRRSATGRLKSDAWRKENIPQPLRRMQKRLRKEERGKREERAGTLICGQEGMAKQKMNKWRNKGVIFGLERKQEIICYSSEAKRSKL